MLAIALFTTDLPPGIRGVGAGVFGRIYLRYEKSNSWLPITNFLSANFDLYPNHTLFRPGVSKISLLLSKKMNGLQGKCSIL